MFHYKDYLTKGGYISPNYIEHIEIIYLENNIMSHKIFYIYDLIIIDILDVRYYLLPIMDNNDSIDNIMHRLKHNITDICPKISRI